MSLTQHPNRLFHFLCRTEDLPTAMLVQELFPRQVRGAVIVGKQLFFVACARGWLDVIRWMLRLSLALAARSRAQLVKLQHRYRYSSACKPHPRGILNVRAKNGLGYRLACAHGHVHVAEWLISRDRRLESLCNMDRAFASAVRQNHVAVLHRMIDSNRDLDCFSAFQAVAIRPDAITNPELLPWILQRFYERGQLKQHCLNACFKTACHWGRQDIAAWLLSTFPSIDVSAWGNEAFWGTCQAGHLDVAQWLVAHHRQKVHPEWYAHTLASHATAHNRPQLAAWLRTFLV